PHPGLTAMSVLSPFEEAQDGRHGLEPFPVARDDGKPPPVVAHLSLARETRPADGGRPVGAVATGHPAVRPDCCKERISCALGRLEQRRGGGDARPPPSR